MAEALLVKMTRWTPAAQAASRTFRVPSMLTRKSHSSSVNR